MSSPRNLLQEFNNGRVLYIFRRSEFCTPRGDDTPRFYRQGLAQTGIVQPRPNVPIVPRRLMAEFDNEFPKCEICQKHCEDVTLCLNPHEKHAICSNLIVNRPNAICVKDGCGHNYYRRRDE